MNIIREDTVRQLHLKQNQTEIHVCPGDYITPQARDYIRDKRLRLVVEKASVEENLDIRPSTEQKTGRYVTEDGRTMSEKPEHMTHLHGNVLVSKNHPRIVLRGQLDALEAEIIAFQVCSDTSMQTELMGRLDQLLDFCRSLLSCEVTGKPLPALDLLGMEASELREVSHHPREHFGIGHLLPNRWLGPVCAGLNRLRTLSRETELVAVNAFCRPDGTAAREDLLRGLNRLSSAFYILMLRQAAAQNNKQGVKNHE